VSENYANGQCIDAAAGVTYSSPMTSPRSSPIAIPAAQGVRITAAD
jgi:hypothetical protein